MDKYILILFLIVTTTVVLCLLFSHKESDSEKYVSSYSKNALLRSFKKCVSCIGKSSCKKCCKEKMCSPYGPPYDKKSFRDYCKSKCDEVCEASGALGKINKCLKLFGSL